MQTNEIYVWQEEVPVVNINPNLEFDIWQEEVPVLDVDESYPLTTTVRRRVFIF